MIVNIQPTADGGFIASQIQNKPAVYLDLCALPRPARELAQHVVQTVRKREEPSST